MVPEISRFGGHIAIPSIHALHAIMLAVVGDLTLCLIINEAAICGPASEGVVEM